MKNLKQVQIIHTALSKEKDRLLSELSKMNLRVNKKMESVKRVLAYYREYSEGNHLSLSKSIPALHKNLDSFSNRMLDIVKIEEVEIANLVKHISSKLKEIEVVENKMKLMDHFSGTIISDNNVRLENIEQMTIDDLSSMKHTRGDHE